MSAQDYPCSNRNKCRNSKRCEIHERPERDTQRGIPNKPSNNFTPPKSPGPDWELQYCKWSGWTYVKKKEEVSQKSKPEIQDPEPKKSQSSHIPEYGHSHLNRNLIGYFQRQKEEKRRFF